MKGERGLEIVKTQICSYRDYYKTLVQKFLEREARYMEFNSECDIIFLHSVLKELGFEVLSELKETLYTPQIIPYVTPKGEGDLVYVYFHPLSFTIGLIKDSALIERLSSIGAKNLNDLEHNFMNEITSLVNTIKQKEAYVIMGRYYDFLPTYLKPNQEDLGIIMDTLNDDKGRYKGDLVLPIYNEQITLIPPYQYSEIDKSPVRFNTRTHTHTSVCVWGKVR